MARTRGTTTGRGVSLAKGPVAIVGIVLLAFAILALITGSTQFKAHVPNGPVSGHKFLGFELNGWSVLLTGGAGLLLLFSSAIHMTAKSMAMLVGLVLGAAAIISVAQGVSKGVFGIFAANHPTQIGWGAAAVVLILLSMLPRVGRRRAAPVEERTVTRNGARDDAVAAETPGRRRLRDRV